MSVTNDIMCAVDQKKAVVLVLVDLSAAFDTIDHSILLNLLHKRYGITGTALRWFETYLTDRCQVIQLNGESSDEMRLKFGVPQGSVLGPLSFTLYTAPLGEITRRHSVELHLYADDTQVYMSFSPLSDESTTRTFQRIEACIAEIRTWLKDNKLMLDDDKTDVLVISSVSMRSKFQVPHLKIGSSIVTPSPVVTGPEDLPVIFFSHLFHRQNSSPSEQQVNWHIVSCFHYIETGQWECVAVWYFRVLVSQASACLKCDSSAHY